MDAVLIRRCRGGDQDAFAELFERYKNLVFRTTYLTLGSANDAEDILQEVFLQVHRSLDEYNPARGAFSTWLYRITVNTCLNWRRRRASAGSLEELDEERMPSSAFPLDAFARDDCVRRSLDNLSRKLRIVVVLRHFWGLSYAEIAEITELPLGTVKSRLNLALRQMRNDLEPDFLCSTRSVTEA